MERKGLVVGGGKEKRRVLLILPYKSMVSGIVSAKYKVLSYSCTADIRSIAVSTCTYKYISVSYF